MIFPLLTDEQIYALWPVQCWAFAQESDDFARAVESATRAPLLAEIERLTAELAAARKALALVQQHHATAWNRGHTMGMAANRDIARQAQAAVARDAWGNTQLTEALLAAEAERDEARAELAAAREDAERINALATPGWELSKNTDPECLLGELWQVHRVSGGRNDREWSLIGQGMTPRAAIDAARGQKDQADTQRGA